MTWFENLLRIGPIVAAYLIAVTLFCVVVQWAAHKTDHLDPDWDYEWEPPFNMDEADR